MEMERMTTVTVPKISFCITCKGRLEHLKQTLPRNLEYSEVWPNVEFVVEAYGDPETAEWIRRRYPDKIADKTIRLIEVNEEDAPYYLYAHSRNMAFRMATGDILTSLDADNVMTKGYVNWLGRTFCGQGGTNLETNLVVRAMNEKTGLPQHESGGGGRLAISKDLFYRVGGYDEVNHNESWSGEDRDLVRRAVAAGAAYQSSPEELLGEVIEHSDDERARYLTPGGQRASRKNFQISKEISKEIWKLNEIPPEGQVPKEGIGRFQEFIDEMHRPDPSITYPVANRNRTGALAFGCGAITLTTGGKMLKEQNDYSAQLESETITLTPIRQRRNVKTQSASSIER